MNTADQALSSTTVISGKLHRIRQGHRKRFTETPPVTPEQVRRPARVAIMLALAHKIQRAIDGGVVRDRAEVARGLGLTRARITQLLDLTLLAPDIQEQILLAEATNGIEPMAERQLRAVVKNAAWKTQRATAPTDERAGDPDAIGLGGPDSKQLPFVDGLCSPASYRL
jgi:hypothetical protein